MTAEFEEPHPVNDKDVGLAAVLRKIRYDLTAAQGKLTEAMRMVATLDIPDPSTLECPRCGVKVRGPNTLAEHLYTSHDGPTPIHWEHIESLSLEPEPEAAT